MQIYSDEFFIQEALKEAKKAFEKEEVPVGAVVVYENKIIARGHNLTEQLNDVTAHAEIQALSAASSFLGAKYLNDCTMYVSLEPCHMCAGALFWAQLDRLVFGAYDTKRGFSSFGSWLLHPKTQVKGGILEKQSAEMMRMFFDLRR